MSFKAYLKACAFVLSIYIVSVIIWGIGFIIYSPDIEHKTIFHIFSYFFIVDIPILMLSIISMPLSLIIEFIVCSETSHINGRGIKGIFLALLSIMFMFFLMFAFYKTKESYEGIYISLGLILLLTAYIKFMLVRYSQTISPIFNKVTT